MVNYKRQVEAEQIRLRTNDVPEDSPLLGLEVRYIVMCRDGAQMVVERAKEVLTLIDESTVAHAFDTIEWQEILPEWFLEKCSPERSHNQVIADQSRIADMSFEERLQYENAWSLREWIYYFAPANREWYWWCCEFLTPDVVKISVSTQQIPFPDGTFHFMLMAAGAELVEQDV